MFRIINNVLEKNLMYDNTVVLKYHIEYPTIYLNSYDIGVIKFNLFNQNEAMELKNRSENELYNEAVEVYKYNKENGYPLMQFEVYRNYEITLNTQNIVSLYTDEYIFTGGAHGNTLRKSQNWNIPSCKMIKLEELYPNNPYFMIEILKTINEQISKNSENYFEDSCMLVLETFNPESFYLTPTAIVIFFQQYDIAPYSSGIPTFKINRKL